MFFAAATRLATHKHLAGYLGLVNGAYCGIDVVLAASPRPSVFYLLHCFYGIVARIAKQSQRRECWVRARSLRVLFGKLPASPRVCARIIKNGKTALSLRSGSLRSRSGRSADHARTIYKNIFACLATAG